MNVPLLQRVGDTMSHPLRLLRGATLATVLTLSAAAGAQPPTPAPTPTHPTGAEIELGDEPAEGTTVRRGVSRFVVQAPMAEVVRAFMDYGHYTDLLPQVTTSRVVRRTRAGTEVYLQVDLGGNLGALWSRVRVTVERTPQRVTFQGTSLEGNVELLYRPMPFLWFGLHGGMVRLGRFLEGKVSTDPLPDGSPWTTYASLTWVHF
jgi:hypothetical protein